MKLHRSILLFSLCAVSIQAHPVGADVLCVQKNIKAAKNGVIALSKAMKTVSGATCPGGFMPLLHSSLFQGPAGPKGDKGDKGDMGASGLAGPQGPAGAEGSIDISTCRVVGNSLSTSDGVTGLTTSCASNEFVFNYGFSYDHPTSAFVHANYLILDSFNYPVSWYVNTSLSSTDYYYSNAADRTWTLTTTIICCPR